MPLCTCKNCLLTLLPWAFTDRKSLQSLLVKPVRTKQTEPEAHKPVVPHAASQARGGFRPPRGEEGCHGAGEVVVVPSGASSDPLCCAFCLAGTCRLQAALTAPSPPRRRQWGRTTSPSSPREPTASKSGCP